MRAFLFSLISLLFLLFVGVQTFAARPDYDDGPRIENVVQIEYVMPCVTVAAPFVVIPDAPVQVTATPYLSTQITAWYAERLTKPGNTSRVGRASTATIYCSRSLYALHGKPPYADVLRQTA